MSRAVVHLRSGRADVVVVALRAGDHLASVDSCNVRGTGTSKAEAMRALARELEYTAEELRERARQGERT